MKEQILSLTLQDLQNVVPQSFRAKQIFEWIYEKKVEDFDQMTNLSKELRAEIKEKFCLFCLKLEKEQSSKDHETKKYLWKAEDNSLFESVLILAEGRCTVCVSTQVGCASQCAFCASGRNGLIRNLTKGEIIEQVLHIDRELFKEQKRVSHIVFMGMGEPLDNFDNVCSAIEVFQDEKAFGISKRRITLSTVGVAEGLKKMTEKKMAINLVLSLHAPTQALREKLIPYAKKIPLLELLQLTDDYFNATKRNVTYEYILIKGVNDSLEHARQLVALLEARQCSINLIPYNPIEGSILKKPDTANIEEFEDYLNRYIPTTRRYTKGADIAAACGQLVGA